jgi:formyltetrahydrofolate hydrolase
MPTHLLLIDCADAKGLVHTVTGVLFRGNFNIIGNQEFVEPTRERFFMRTAFAGEGDPLPLVEELRTLLPPQASVRLAATGKRPYQPEYLVLAKYMRILSPDFIARWPRKIVNIHHSFLPAFVGANPYRQAYDRGVKIIGATAHFVTDQLDEGPIIAQAIQPVDHSYQPADMAQAGRDVEKLVLARALRLVLEERVFLLGNRTVIFE